MLNRYNLTCYMLNSYIYRITQAILAMLERPALPYLARRASIQSIRRLVALEAYCDTRWDIFVVNEKNLNTVQGRKVSRSFLS